MADYWKSQPRKFCEYCKCWIADNKPSIEFHERGKNHKENVAAKISQIKKKSMEKAKQEQRMTKEFAKMEEAAMKAYEEDLKRMEREAAGIVLPEPTRTPPQPRAKPTVKNQPKIKKKNKGKTSQKPREARQAQVWVEGLTADGHMYYYNTLTGESRWEKPGGFQGGSSASAPPERSSGCPWMEAVTPEGHTYYYNSTTGESSWEKPADFQSSKESGSSREGESREEPSAAQSEPSAAQSEPSAAQSELLSAGEESSNGEAKVEEPKQQSNVPKISFRKGKAEVEPSEKEGDSKIGEDTPKEDAEEMKKEEEVQSTPAEPEKRQQQVVTQRETQAKKLKAVNPYGAWEQIREEKDPYADVDLELPQVEESTSSTTPDLPPEPKRKFKERIITSLGDEGGPAAFRKNKTQNGKSRNLRQRDDDDD